MQLKVAAVKIIKYRSHHMYTKSIMFATCVKMPVSHHHMSPRDISPTPRLPDRETFGAVPYTDRCPSEGVSGGFARCRVCLCVRLNNRSCRCHPASLQDAHYQVEEYCAICEQFGEVVGEDIGLQRYQAAMQAAGTYSWLSTSVPRHRKRTESASVQD